MIYVWVVSKAALVRKEGLNSAKTLFVYVKSTHSVFVVYLLLPLPLPPSLVTVYPPHLPMNIFLFVIRRGDVLGQMSSRI